MARIVHTELDGRHLNEDCRPITERSNAKSKNIDTSSPQDIIKCLHSCEEEIFTGWEDFMALCDDDTVEVIQAVSRHAQNILQNPSEGLILMSGCGTSGRLAFFVATKMNAFLRSVGRPQCFDYLIAGGERGLTHSVEAFEDSPEAGRNDLLKAVEGKTNILYIGITCGLSAPYIAGQLAHCLSQLEVFTPVLLGFNPVTLARDTTIEGWHQTFHSVAKRLGELQDSRKGFILNPVIGPEAITGSSRLKGGSATIVLLETCLFTAISSFDLLAKTTSSSSPSTSTTAANHHGNPKPTANTSADHRENEKDGLDGTHEKLITTLFDCYRQIWEDSFQSSQEKLSQIITQAGKSLSSGSHVYYIGWDTWGILGLIDASECPPTFGSDFDDVRGFLEAGLSSKLSQPSMNTGVEDETSIQYFQRCVLPSLTRQDTIVFLLPTSDPKLLHEAESLMLQAAEKTLQIGIISSGSDTSVTFQSSHTHIAILPTPAEMSARLREAGLARTLEGAVWGSVSELAVKSCLNAISTGAHIAKGKVFENFMVDLRLSNSKLLERGRGIVERFGGCGADDAQDAVMRSIYQTDDISLLRKESVSSIIATAGNAEKVVPRAIILARRKCSVQAARLLQEKHPIIRTSLQKLLEEDND